MEVTKKDVEKLIEVMKENSFLNHLLNVLSRDMRPKGEIKLTEIHVWRQNFWNMTFYPIFTFEFDTNNHLTKINDKINPIGKSLIMIITLGLIWLIFPKNITEFDIVDKWQMITFLCVFAFLIVWVARKVYKLDKNSQLEQIFEVLDVEMDKKIPENEWSLKNILIRLFTYPFCLFLIGLNIYLIIPNGQYIHSLITFAIVGLYLFADIKMILKNKKNYCQQ